MSVTILKGKDTDNFAFENGKEVIWYDENPATGHIIATKPIAPMRVGYNRHKTTQPKEMDRVFKRLNEQEREAGQKFVEKLWGRGRPYYDKLRSRLTQRLLATDCSNWERTIIKDSLRLMEERQNEELEVDPLRGKRDGRIYRAA